MQMVNFYICIFFSQWYIGRKIQRSSVLASCLQIFWAVFTITNCVTRITDRRHRNYIL